MSANTTTTQPRMTAEEFRLALENSGQTIVYRNYLEKLRAKAQQAPCQATTEHEIKGVANIHNAVQALWERAVPGLSDKELEWFTNCGAQADFFLGYLAETTERAGCLILNDTTTGAYEDKDSVADLLFFLAESIQTANALVTMSASANYRLLNKELFAAMATGNR